LHVSATKNLPNNPPTLNMCNPQLRWTHHCRWQRCNTQMRIRLQNNSSYFKSKICRFQHVDDGYANKEPNAGGAAPLPWLIPWNGISMQLYAVLESQ
jgi:hypothetical protein